ncbi:receptor-type tyrosine-protein phosphatase-like N isoform X2 [Carettochelys insculpta]|uniref:receptor-type tyrosine-protein phosphatase-like N isoform X2 n=1 Tax=Carettochelys insculpta TaxID=44489 RepID=UPI003EBC9B49
MVRRGAAGMGRRLLRALLCLLLVAGRLPRAGGAGPHGCLFDRRLCSQQEVCVQDGLFGQCQVSMVQDRPYLQLSSPVLQRLQDVLRQLTAQGLSWQDNLTQHVIAQEMERIPRLNPPARQELAVPDRLPPLHANPQRAPFPDPSQLGSPKALALHPPPASARKALPPAPLPPALLQRYLAVLLLAAPPELGYEEGLLQPYPYPKFGYQDGVQQLSPTQGNLARHSPEPSMLLGRAPAQASPALFGAPSVASFGGQPGLDRGPLLQALDLLYLPREKPNRLAAASTRAQHSWGIPPASSKPDYRNRPQQPGLAPPAQPDAALQRLMAVLADYGVGLQDLSPQQLGSLSALLQLLQRPGGFGQQAPEAKRVTEGEMQHSEEPEPPPSMVAPPENLATAASWTAGPRREEATGPVQGQARPTWASQAASQASARAPEGGDQLGPARPVPVKKSYVEPAGRGGAGAPTEEYGYIVTDRTVVGPALTFRLRQNHQNLSLADLTRRAELVKSELEAELGLKIVQTGVGQRNEATPYPHPSHAGNTFHVVLLTFLALACVAGVAIAAAIVACLRQHAKQREKDRLAALGPEGAGDSTFEYQELCRQHMAAKSLFGRADAPPAPAENSRVSSVSSQFSDAPQASPSSHSSTPSWCEEPAQPNMDISTGHMILAYMEDHLRNRDRLAKEWQALCAYQAEPNGCTAAHSEANLKKNRNPDYVPYDHARIKLKAENNPSRSDFINASPITEHDPRMPAYIATQGPLSHTIADFWQMVWENGCTVIVMLSPLVEDGLKQCDRYWPDEGSSLYHVYEVNLVSEHIWCEDFLVRSFYLKNVQSQETRTLTQFHFLSWPAEGIPTTTRPLLDFRRKVNKCYRGRSCPVIVHCSDGAGRTGTYILIDMVLNRMGKGVKEIDIAATLEHVRDQRPGMVQTKDQFEFALTAVAEEVNAILKALPQ